MTGVEYFYALNTLSCYDNELTALDVSKNVYLTSLDCGSNQLTNLDISKNVNLTRLKCGSNRLVALDLSNNKELRSLSCDSNLRSFDDKIIEGKSYVALSELEKYGFDKDMLEDQTLIVTLDDGAEYLCLGDCDSEDTELSLTYVYNTGNESYPTLEFTISRTVKTETGIDALDNGDGTVNVYNLNGTIVRSSVREAEALNGLPNGIYIVKGKKIRK